MYDSLNEMFGLDGKIAFVTGAGSGIGKGAAEGLATAGAHVVCMDIDGAAAEKTAQDICAAGGSAEAYILDVSDEKFVNNAFSYFESQGKDPDILFNIAGVAHVPKKAEDFTKNEMDRIFAINFYGTFYCCREAVKTMKKKGYGKIINIVSELSEKSGGGFCPGMGATKGAVKSFTLDLACAYAADGIRVNAMSPGDVNTNISKDIFKDMDYEEAASNFSWEKPPIGYIAEPDDIKGLSVYLASRASDYMTGSIVTIDGGVFIE